MTLTVVRVVTGAIVEEQPGHRRHKAVKVAAIIATIVVGKWATPIIGNMATWSLTAIQTFCRVKGWKADVATVEV